MSTDKRQPAGIPTGGQFAASAKDEADVYLGASVSAPANPSVANLDVEGHEDAVAPCPDCGAPIAGAIPGATNSVGGPAFIPGAHCSACPHTAASYEVASEPDDESAVYVYTLAHDGSITVHDEDGDDIETWDLGTTGWHDNAAILDLAGQEDQVRVAVMAVEEPERLLSETCTRMGLPHMGGIYDIVAQRGAVSSGTLLAQTTPEHIAIHNGAHVEQAIDTLGAEYAGLHGRTDLHPDSRASYHAACDEAMLPAMKGVYDELDRRNLLTNGSARLINADDVERDYFAHIGPAVDRVESSLLG